VGELARLRSACLCRRCTPAEAARVERREELDGVPPPVEPPEKVASFPHGLSLALGLLGADAIAPCVLPLTELHRRRGEPVGARVTERGHVRPREALRAEVHAPGYHG